MSIENKAQLLEFNGWVYRFRPASGDQPARLLLLLHGLTGDENVMWVFTRRLPKMYAILAPRAPFPAGSGYTWVNPSNGIQAPIQDYLGAVQNLHSFLEKWEAPPGLTKTPFSIMGFSQGAALAYTYSLVHPEEVERLVGLAGFLPGEVERWINERPLSGKPVFIAHGTRDEQVPVELARQTVERLEQAGAQVDYCEADVEHKLGAECLRGMEAFLA